MGNDVGRLSFEDTHDRPPRDWKLLEDGQIQSLQEAILSMPWAAFIACLRQLELTAFEPIIDSASKTRTEYADRRKAIVEEALQIFLDPQLVVLPDGSVPLARFVQAALVPNKHQRTAHARGGHVDRQRRIEQSQEIRAVLLQIEGVIRLKILHEKARQTAGHPPSPPTRDASEIT